MWSIINHLANTASEPMLVFRMLLKLKPRSTDDWPWLWAGNNLRTNESSWYLEISLVLKKKLPSQSLSAENYCNSAVYLDKSSSEKDLKSPVALSHFWGDITSRSMKHLRRTLDFSSNFSVKKYWHSWWVKNTCTSKHCRS